MFSCYLKVGEMKGISQRSALCKPVSAQTGCARPSMKDRLPSKRCRHEERTRGETACLQKRCRHEERAERAQGRQEELGVVRKIWRVIVRTKAVHQDVPRVQAEPNNCCELAIPDSDLTASLRHFNSKKMMDACRSSSVR
jgi:hypothetical protein